MNSKEIFLHACHRQPVPRPPVWLMRQVGRYQAEYQALRKRFSFIELITRPDVAAEASLFVMNGIDPDAIILFSDILTVLAAMGAELSYEPKLKVTADLSRLNMTPNETWLVPAYETLHILKDEVQNKKALIGFAGAPYTLLYYLMGRGEEVRAILPMEEAATRDLLDKLANIVAWHLRQQHKAGADVLQIFDSHAGELPPHLYETFALAPLRQVVDQLSDVDCPLIVFGRGRHHLAHRRALPNCVLSLDWTIPLADVPDAEHLAVQGNLDPAMLLGGPALTREATNAMLASAHRFGGYIANLGHGVLPKTPVNSVQAFVETVKSFAYED